MAKGGKVTTRYAKVERPKRRGRPKKDKSIVLKRQPRETSDIEEFLNENNGTAPWLKLIEQYQSECDHDLWPQRVMATKGNADSRQEVIQCTGCWWVRKTGYLG